MSPKRKLEVKNAKVAELDAQLAKIESDFASSKHDEQVARVESGEPLRKVLGNKGRTKRKFVGAGRGNPHPHGTVGYRVKKGVVVEDRVKYEQAKERYTSFMKRMARLKLKPVVVS